MKTIPLRLLLREPSKVKRITRTGQSVQVTDNRQPLWVIQPAVGKEDRAARRREIEQELAAVLQGAKGNVALSKIVLKSRR